MPFAELFLRPCLLLFTCGLAIMGGWALQGARSGEAACVLHLTVCQTGAGVQWSHLRGGGEEGEKKRKKRRYSI